MTLMTCGGGDCRPPAIETCDMRDVGIVVGVLTLATMPGEAKLDIVAFKLIAGGAPGPGPGERAIVGVSSPVAGASVGPKTGVGRPPIVRVCGTVIAMGTVATAAGPSAAAMGVAGIGV